MVVFNKPKLETLARVAEMAAAVAVVVSVIYLGKQIADNTKLLRSQSHFNAISLGQRPLELLMENESLAGEVIQCNANPGGVAAATWERCRNYYFMQFNAWEYMYYQNVVGRLIATYGIVSLGSRHGHSGRHQSRKFKLTYRQDNRERP